ncbi:hypothetical protein SNE40_012532 [Patella caerulea]|uniref:PDZ domain-containing protein n=1 Tax=Patella caerulea TaxID=87958 RepID=A0AAN8JRT9_PATCE
MENIDKNANEKQTTSQADRTDVQPDKNNVPIPPVRKVKLARLQRSLSEEPTASSIESTPPVRKVKLARLHRSISEETTTSSIESKTPPPKTHSVNMESESTESDFSDFDHSLFSQRNLSSPPLKHNTDKSEQFDINPRDGRSQNIVYSFHGDGEQKTSNPQRKHRQYIVNPDDSDSAPGLSRNYYPMDKGSSIMQNANLTTDSSSYESTTDTESEIASPVRDTIYGLRYRKFHSKDIADYKSDEDGLSDVETVEQLMLHRLPGENLGMILGVEAGKKGSSKVQKVIVKSVTLGGAAYRATGGSRGIRVRDEILEVNGKVLGDLTHDECVTVFHEMPLRVVLSVKLHNLPKQSQHAFHERLGPLSSWPRYNGYRSSEVSDTESESEQPSGFKLRDIVIHKTSKENLGISIVPSYGSTREYYQVKRLLPSGVCARDREVHVGDRLVACNGQTLKGVTQNECLNILKTAGNDLTLTVLSQVPSGSLNMDSNLDGRESTASLETNNNIANGDDLKQQSDHGFSSSKSNANVLFAQKNVKLTYSQPFVTNHDDSLNSSYSSSALNDTGSAIGQYDQHILDLTGGTNKQLKHHMEAVRNNGDSFTDGNISIGADNSFVSSTMDIPPPAEFSDDPLSQGESETSTLNNSGEINVPVTNIDDLLDLSTSTPVHTAAASNNNFDKHFPENDELLIIETNELNNSGVKSEPVLKSGNTPSAGVRNVGNYASSVNTGNTLQTESETSPCGKSLDFQTRVSNVIKDGQQTTLFDVGVKSVSQVQQTCKSVNIDDLLSPDPTNKVVETVSEYRSSTDTSSRNDNQVVRHGRHFSAVDNTIKTKQQEQTPIHQIPSSANNVTTVQVGFISLEQETLIDEGLVTKVPVVNENSDKKGSQPIENQVTNIVVNEAPRITRVDVGYEHSSELQKQKRPSKLPGSTVFNVDGDSKDSNTAHITFDNQSDSPKLSPVASPRRHLPKSDFKNVSPIVETDFGTLKMPTSAAPPKPVPRRSHPANKKTSTELSPSLNRASLVPAAQPNATILIDSGQSEQIAISDQLNNVQSNAKITDSTNEQPVVAVNKKSTTIEVQSKPQRPKTSKAERSDRSDRITVTTYQDGPVKLARSADEEETIQPMAFVQDELGNRSCVATPPRTPQKQKLKDQNAKNDLSDILLQLVNVGSGADSSKSEASSESASIVDESPIERKKVSRETVETVLDAFSKIIPSREKDQPKKSIFQKAVSDVIDDIDEEQDSEETQSKSDLNTSILTNQQPVVTMHKKSTTIEVQSKPPRPKTSKADRSDRSDRITVTTYQDVPVKLARSADEEETIQPMAFVQDELGNRSCVATPPRSPQKQKHKDQNAKNDLSDILLQLVNVGSGADGTKPESSESVSVVDESPIERKKVSRETVETVLDAFSKIIPSLEKDQPKKSVFQKAVSDVIDDIDDNDREDNSNVPENMSVKSLVSDTVDHIKNEKNMQQNQPPQSVSGLSGSVKIDSKHIIKKDSENIAHQRATFPKSEQSIKTLTKNTEITENTNLPNLRQHQKSTVVTESQTTRITEKPVSLNLNQSSVRTDPNRTHPVTTDSEKTIAKKPLSLNISQTSPKKFSTSPHVTTIRTQPGSYSSIKTSLTSFSSKTPKADYPKRRTDDSPFQIDVLKGIAGLGIKLAVGKDGLAKVTNIQTTGPVAKNGQMRVGDYVLSINSTVLTGQSDNRVQQILRLLPRGLSKLVISTKPPDVTADKTGPLTIDTDTTLDDSMELSPGSPANTGFTKYGVRLSPKPFSSLGAQSSPTTAKSFAEGLAVIKEGKFSPVAAPTYRKVSIDKQSETHVEFPFDKNAPEAPSTTATNGTANGASISNKPSENGDSVKEIDTDTLSSSAKNGHGEEIAIKTDLSSTDSTPSLSPRSPRLDETDSKPRVSPKTSPRQDTTKVHATQIFVGKESKESKLGIDIPKSRAESKIIAATWGKELDEDTLTQSVKSPPPVAPKPKLRAPKPVPEVPQESAVPTRQKEKSPGAETLKLTDKLKKFETEIQRQTDSAKPAAPPITSRRTSSSSEHSTASIRSSSPDRDVFLQDERKAPEVKSRSYAQDKHSPHMVFTTTVSNKGDLAADQNRAYSMKIANTDNTTEITRTEIRKQSVEENPSLPKRRTSSSTQSPLSPSSPFFQDLSEKPAKINPVKLNRALAPKGSPQNQNVEIKSTVKLTAPSYLPSDSKGKKPSQQSWFAGKESSSSMSNVECTSSPSNVVSTKPHLVYQSPGKPSQSLTSPKQSTKSPDLVSSTKSDLDNLLSKESPSSSEIKVEYVSPKSKSAVEEKRKSLTDQFDSLLNLDSGYQDGIVAASVVHIEPKTNIDSEPEYSQQVTEKESLVENNTPVILDDIQVEKVAMVESSPPENREEESKVQDEANQEVAVREMEQLHSENTDDNEPAVLENKDVESSLVDYQSAEEGDEVNEDQTLLSESVVEPFAAALVEKVIDSAKDSFLNSLSNGEIQSEENGISEEVGSNETFKHNNEMEVVDREVEESFSPVSAEVNQSKPDIINDVVDGNQCPDLQNDHISAPETADSEKSPSPPPLPDAPPPPLPSSPPPPMMSIPPPVSMMGSIEDPPDLVEFMSNDLIPTLKMDDFPKPDLVTDNPFMKEEEEIEIETVANVSSVPNMIGVISADKLPDNQSAITVNNEIESSSVICVDKNEYQKNVNGVDTNETMDSNVDTLVATETMSSYTDTLVTTETEGSSVDPLDFVENNSMSNSACAPEHEDLSVVSAYDTMTAVDQRVTKNSAVNVDITNDSVSTNVNNVPIDGKNDLLDSNENLFSAKPVVISPVSETQSHMSDISNITNNSTTSSHQVSSFQQSLPSTDQNNEESAKIFSSTPARGQGTPQLVTKNIDIESSIKSDTSNASTLLDTSEYVNISITSNGPNITNEAFKVSSSKRDWSFLSNDKDSSVIEGKANTSFEFLDFSNITLIEPEELKRLVDLANQTMDKTGGSIHDQIIVALLHRNQPTDKVGLELKKGSHGKILVSGLSEDGLASVDGKVHVLDCLLSVNGKSIDDRTIQDIQQAVETPCITVVLVLSRGDNSKHMSLNISKDSEPVKTSTTPMTPTTPTTPSYSETSYTDYATGDPVEVVMTKGATGVGFCLEGGIGSPRGDMPIIIKRIFKGGPAEKCGQLQVRDQILRVNDMDFTAMRHYEAWNHLKFLPDGEVKLTIRRNTNLTSTPTE